MHSTGNTETFSGANDPSRVSAETIVLLNWTSFPQLIRKHILSSNHAGLIHSCQASAANYEKNLTRSSSHLDEQIRKPNVVYDDELVRFARRTPCMGLQVDFPHFSLTAHAKTYISGLEILLVFLLLASELSCCHFQGKVNFCD